MGVSLLQLVSAGGDEILVVEGRAKDPAGLSMRQVSCQVGESVVAVTVVIVVILVLIPCLTPFLVVPVHRRQIERCPEV